MRIASSRILVHVPVYADHRPVALPGATTVNNYNGSIVTVRGDHPQLSWDNQNVDQTQERIEQVAPGYEQLAQLLTDVLAPSAPSLDEAPHGLSGPTNSPFATVCVAQGHARLQQVVPDRSWGEPEARPDALQGLPDRVPTDHLLYVVRRRRRAPYPHTPAPE